MASNTTANYGLSQWEPGDAFVRAEFNRDNAAVDAALGEKADRAEVSALAETVNGKAGQGDVDRRFQAVSGAVGEKAAVAAGSYTGDDAASRTVSLPFTPKAVLVESCSGLREGDGKFWGGLAVAGSPAVTGAAHTLVSLTGGGFRVYNGGNAGTNRNGSVYHYVAWG